MKWIAKAHALIAKGKGLCMSSVIDKCDACGGTGLSEVAYRSCPHCNGTGHVLFDELADEDGPLDLEDQLERALDQAFPSAKEV